MATSHTTLKGMECIYYLDGWYMVKVKDKNVTACRMMAPSAGGDSAGKMLPFWIFLFC
jgi:hypothetical protein